MAKLFKWPTIWFDSIQNEKNFAQHFSHILCICCQRNGLYVLDYLAVQCTCFRAESNV